MKIYFGITIKEDFDLLKELSKYRQDFGVLVSAYYYFTKGETRKTVQKLKEEGFPLIADNGAYQTYKHGSKPFTNEKLRDFTKEINPEFLIAPDVMGLGFESSTQSLVSFIKNNDDLELLAPLQSTNHGPLFEDKITEEIAILKDSGYTRFGFGKPYAIKKMTRPEGIERFVPMVRPRVDYLHYLAWPINTIGGNHLTQMQRIDSADVGTYSIMTKFRFNPYAHPKEGAELINALLNVNHVAANITRDGEPSLNVPIERYLKTQNIVEEGQRTLFP